VDLVRVERCRPARDWNHLRASVNACVALRRWGNLPAASRNRKPAREYRTPNP